MLKGYVTKKSPKRRRRRRRQNNTTTSAEVGCGCAAGSGSVVQRTPPLSWPSFRSNTSKCGAVERARNERWWPTADCRWPNTSEQTRVPANERTNERESEPLREQLNERAHIALHWRSLSICCCSLSPSVQICMRICFWPAVCSTRHCALLWSSFQLAVGQRHRNFRRAATLTATATETATTTRLGLRGRGRRSSSSCNANQKCVQGNNFWKTYIRLQTKERRGEKGEWIERRANCRNERERERSFVYNYKLVDPLIDSTRVELSSLHSQHLFNDNLHSFQCLAAPAANRAWFLRWNFRNSCSLTPALSPVLSLALALLPVRALAHWCCYSLGYPHSKSLSLFLCLSCGLSRSPTTKCEWTRCQLHCE